MTCKEIIEKYFTDNGFDGLAHLETECGCHMGDFFPCDAYAHNDCQPAYFHEDENGNWEMRLTQKESIDATKRDKRTFKKI